MTNFTRKRAPLCLLFLGLYPFFSSAQTPSNPSDLILDRLALDSGLSLEEARSMKPQLQSEWAMRQLLAKKTVLEHLDHLPEVVASMKVAQTTALAHAYLDRLESSLVPAAEDILSDYQSSYPIKTMALVKIAIYTKSDIASKLLNDVRSGITPFDEAALQADDELLSRYRGTLGWLPLDALPDEVVAELKTHPSRFPAAPIKTRFGYIIYDFKETKQEREKPFEMVQSHLIEKRKQLMMRIELGHIKQEADATSSSFDLEAPPSSSTRESLFPAQNSAPSSKQ